MGLFLQFFFQIICYSCITTQLIFIYWFFYPATLANLFVSSNSFLVESSSILKKYKMMVKKEKEHLVQILQTRREITFEMSLIPLTLNLSLIFEKPYFFSLKMFKTVWIQAPSYLGAGSFTFSSVGSFISLGTFDWCLETFFIVMTMLGRGLLVSSSG